jgi:HK97 family phage prohead protease
MTPTDKIKLKNERQLRALQVFTPAETKRIDSNYYVEGYAARYEPYVLYEDEDGPIYERFDPGCFDGCDMSDVIMQYDHQGRVFARTRNRTLTIRVDEKGLYIAADLGGTEEGRKLYQEIKDGYTDRMSFGFVVERDSRSYTEDYDTGAVTVLRTILKIRKLYDVSAVSIPANDMTSISARRLADGVMAGRAEERRREQRERLKLKFLLEGI